MPFIQPREFRIEVIEGQSFAMFRLSESPDPTWIVRFEECLAKQSGIAVVVVDERVRTSLPPSEDLPRFIRLVQRCIQEANHDGEPPQAEVLD